MASSDNSLGSEYQVFLSFRGPDTRVGFTDFLFHSLTDAGICVFRDDEELRAGERIDGSLLRAIDNSRIYIPIFSQNYASSQWCLRELTQIMKNTFKSENNKVILPIFYDVEPADVKLNTWLYHDAILNLQSKKKLSEDQVDAWRDALKKVDGVKGWEVKKYKGHGELIKLVVEEVVERLKTKHRSVTKHLVGIDDHVVAVSKLLDINSNGVRLVKIYGMGGIGKTTLAKVIFNQLSSHFGKYCCFLEDVRERSSRVDGLVDLQRRLLSTIGHPVGTRSIDEIDYGMKRAGEILCNRKVLIILDDVDKNEQVEKLVGNATFSSGSRILITTRIKDALEIITPKYQILDYEMEVMSVDHALELFKKHAFTRDSPLVEYHDLSRKIVDSTGRLPLALEVIGSLLCHKPLELWNETLEKLREGPHEDVFGKLKISYDALNIEQQQIFLDIACFFISKDKTNAIYMWKDCKFFPESGVAVLINMSLVKIMEDNKFWMHDQLRDFGRKIVHLENPINPKEQSRIWILEEGLHAIKSKEMNSTVHALSLETHGRRPRDRLVQSKEVGRFEHLRFLKLSGFTLVVDAMNHLTKLRWISMSSAPRVCIWNKLHLENAVVLELMKVKFSNNSRLHDLIEMSTKLKVLSLRFCENMTQTSSFSRWPNLERVTFGWCYDLRKIGVSIGKLKCLIDLRIEECNSLKNLPEEIGDLVNLQYLFIKCDKVRKLPNSSWKLKSLRELHFRSWFHSNDPVDSWELPSRIGMLQNLEVLQVRSPNLIGQLPSGIGSLSSLRVIDLSYTGISEVPRTISMLPHLQRIELTGCHNIQELPMLPTSLTHLKVLSFSLRIVPDLSNLTNLVELDLADGGRAEDKHCTSDLWWIGRLSKLTKLSIRLHKVCVPTEIASLPLLNKIALFGLDLETSPQFPSYLQELRIDDFHWIVRSSQNLRNLSCLNIWGSPMQEIEVDGLQLPQLKELDVEGCELLERLRLSRMTKLKDVKGWNCPELVEIQFSSALESLETLKIQLCSSLERIVYESANEMISCPGRLILLSRVFNKLRSLTLSGWNKILDIQVVGASESWEYFDLSYCDYLQSIDGLSDLKNLKALYIRGCERLRVVEGVNELESLRELYIRDCVSLERLIDVSTTKLSDDCHVTIDRCRKLRGVEKGFDVSVQSLKHHKKSRFDWTSICFGSS